MDPNHYIGEVKINENIPPIRINETTRVTLACLFEGLRSYGGQADVLKRKFFYHFEAVPEGNGTRLSDEKVRLLDGILGAVTEVVELSEEVTQHVLDDKPIDRTHFIEEVGDVLWYLAVLLDSQGASFGQAMDANIAKLRKRYPEKFDTEKALNRNLKEERKALEGKSNG